MSRSQVVRRRRRGRRATAMAGDAMDLFLDAMTNTLGVVMFILLMVVLFGRPEPRTQLPDARKAVELAALRVQRDDLAARVAALPPAGDPTLVARWRAALDAIMRAQPTVDALRRVILERAANVAAERASAEAAHRAMARALEQVEALERRAAAPDVNMVRVSRFHQDARKAVLLAVSRGLVSRIAVTAATQEIAPPQSGERVVDAGNVQPILQQLLVGVAPATHRVELVVWADSFAAAKAIEQALLNLGYDTNPLPVALGASLKPGTGGVQ